MLMMLFDNEYDLPLNVLVWCALATLAPWIFFSLYAANSYGYHITYDP